MEAKDGVLNSLTGVNGISGLLCGDPKNIENPAIRSIESFGDVMRNGGGHMRHVILESFARLKQTTRSLLIKKLKIAKIYNPSKMRLVDWVHLGMCLLDETQYPEISSDDRAHLSAVDVEEQPLKLHLHLKFIIRDIAHLQAAQNIQAYGRGKFNDPLILLDNRSRLNGCLLLLAKPRDLKTNTNLFGIDGGGPGGDHNRS